jgi:hypothetical protein
MVITTVKLANPRISEYNAAEASWERRANLLHTPQGHAHLTAHAGIICTVTGLYTLGSHRNTTKNCNDLSTSQDRSKIGHVPLQLSPGLLAKKLRYYMALDELDCQISRQTSVNIIRKLSSRSVSRKEHWEVLGHRERIQNRSKRDYRRRRRE